MTRFDWMLEEGFLAIRPFNQDYFTQSMRSHLFPHNQIVSIIGYMKKQTGGKHEKKGADVLRPWNR